MTDDGGTIVATANVLRTLGPADARAALAGVLAEEPDLVGLQEWGPSRRALLAETGRVRVQLGPRLQRRGRAGLTGYLWVSPVLGQCAVGARADRYALLSGRLRPVAWSPRSDRGARPLPVLPPRLVTVAVLGDRRLDREVALICFHLTPGTQRRGAYRPDRPLLVRRHRQETAGLSAIVAEQLAAGRLVHAVGDSNFHGLRLPGLTSAWEGRDGEPGTLGSHRKIDDVHGPGPATSVRLLSSPSDHKAVVVRREDG